MNDTETIRAAAQMMREDDCAYSEEPFYAALASWLDFIAEARVAIDGVAAARSRNGAGWLVSEDTASQVFRDMEARALAIANAYLGVPTDA